MRGGLVAAVVVWAGCTFEVPGLDEELGVADLAPVDLATPEAAADDFAMAPRDLTTLPPDFAIPILASCSALKQYDATLPSGVYAIAPAAGAMATPVYCDMTTLGGGWTMVQRTVYDNVDNAQLITGYAAFYGATVGQPARGHAFRVAAQYWPTLNASGGHLLEVVPRAMDGSDCQRLSYQGVGASWVVPAALGPATIGAVSSAAPLFNNTMQLSTTDVGPSQNCVNLYNCTPWPMTNCCYVCPAYEGYPATYQSMPADLSGVTPTMACGATPATNAVGLFLYNTIEYYVR
jgi:hypothetical protein